jgi:hypothetical protein
MTSGREPTHYEREAAMPDADVHTFEFQPEHDGSLPLATAVFQALGAASACWDNLEGAGVFESERARAVGDALLAFLREQERPLLGLATTRQLLDELRTRIEIDYFAGGGGLDYSTVTGRPEAILDA